MISVDPISNYIRMFNQFLPSNYMHLRLFYIPFDHFFLFRESVREQVDDPKFIVGILRSISRLIGNENRL